MNKRIKKLAEQAYALCGKHNNDYNGPAFTEAFAALVAAQEREECAKVCDGLADTHEKLNNWSSHKTADTLAQAIRARGTT
tara:strand:+ start:387 stop:629 length:243 start_codon:yes stop_codon:yes gene_type:complete